MSDEDNNVIHVNFGGAPDAEEPEPQASDPDSPGAEKCRLFDELLEDGTVMITLDSRRSGVVVPPQFMGQVQLNLNFDHLFGIADFAYDDEGVRASLSFGGVDQWCDVPWSAVFMMRSLESEEVMLFPSELPPEMMALIPEIERAIQAHHDGEADDEEE